MAIPMIQTTRDTLGDDAFGCDSRSLFKDRFADPQATNDERIAWFKQLFAKEAERISRTPWLPATAEQLHARLMSRLMVDLAGGVMENANLSIDRYGLPLIPGSAIKGCARRMALQALHDWIAVGTERPAEDDACAPCCDDFTTPAEMLAAIARVFGWVKDDWSNTRKDDLWKSDFAWACGGGLQPPCLTSVQALLDAARDLLSQSESYAGTIAFLPASPDGDPGLELDVVTPHHAIYHSPEPDRNRDRQKWETWQTHRDAPDTEDPIPVFFPAVNPQAEGNYFTFPLIPLRRAKEGDLALAKRWLSHGLELFGIGAKTHAGYGLFQVLAEGNPAFPARFDPVLSPVEKFLRDWGGKPVNGMNARAFSKLVFEYGAAEQAQILETVAPGKTRDFKDPFWNPFKTDPTGKVVLETLRNHLDSQ
jgi:CRISPR-associated protein Cmr6